MDRGTHSLYSGQLSTYHTISRCVKKNDTNTKTLRLAQLEVAICCTHFSHERSNFLDHAPTTSPGYRSGCASGLMIMMMHDASKPIDKVRCLRYQARSTDRGSRNSGEYVSAASSLDITALLLLPLATIASQKLTLKTVPYKNASEFQRPILTTSC